jgi:uracil-DNA glycosylase
MVKITESWDKILEDNFNSKSYLSLREFLKEEYTKHTVYPDMFDIFNSLKLVPIDKIKVVILGQDPYHEPNEAMGLSFSVKNGVKIPPSLVNIYKEITAETGEVMPTHGDLTGWANQGVLLLNSLLTVRAHKAFSHKGKGWEEFTDGVIKKVNALTNGVVFMLWGSASRSKKVLIDTTKHLVLESVHPSPLSAYNGFFGCNHFIKANEYLISQGKTPIKWSDL